MQFDQTICKKRLWFYRIIILLHTFSIVTPGETFGHLPWSYGLLDSQNKMALMSAKMVSYSCFYWTKNDCSWFTKVCSRCKCNMSHIRLKLMRCHWSCNPRRVKISRHSDHVGLLHTLSTIDAQSKLVLGGLAKLNIWGHSSMGFQKSYNKVASCIRELTANMFLFPLKNFTSEGLI